MHPTEMHSCLCYLNTNHGGTRGVSDHRSHLPPPPKPLDQNFLDFMVLFRDKALLAEQNGPLDRFPATPTIVVRHLPHKDVMLLLSS